VPPPSLQTSPEGPRLQGQELWKPSTELINATREQGAAQSLLQHRCLWKTSRGGEAKMSGLYLRNFPYKRIDCWHFSFMQLPRHFKASEISLSEKQSLALLGTSGCFTKQFQYYYWNKSITTTNPLFKWPVSSLQAMLCQNIYPPNFISCIFFKFWFNLLWWGL